MSTEESLSITSLADSVRHGTTLPAWGPSGQLFMVGNCSGLYLASGISETDVPGLLVDHYTWIPVEQKPAFSRQISFTFNRPGKYFTKPVTLMTYGASSLVLQPLGTGYFRVVLEHSGTSISFPPPRCAKAHLGAPRAVPASGDRGSQPAPDQHHFQRVIFIDTLHRRIRSAQSCTPPRRHPVPHSPRSPWSRSQSPPA